MPEIHAGMKKAFLAKYFSASSMVAEMTLQNDLVLELQSHPITVSALSFPSLITTVAPEEEKKDIASR